LYVKTHSMHKRCKAFNIQPVYTHFQVQIWSRLWHKWGVKDRSTLKKPAPPLNARKLRDLALHYAGRYATTRAKLTRYLQRKITERGWSEGEKIPDLEALALEFSELGYVNDQAFAEARSRSFLRRGYGARRLEQDLHAAGISKGDSHHAREDAANGALMSADAFARRKRIGPYAAETAPPNIKQKQLQAFLRAGHSYDLAGRFVNAQPGDIIDIE
jgi:regulatory protein